MDIPRKPRCHFWWGLQLLVVLQSVLASQVLGYQFKVGDLDGWNIPSSAKPDVYTKWPLNYTFNVGDSLMFLYPPSQDSVIQVTEQSYKSCNIQDPILSMNDGNSVFNITSPGDLYFTSGMLGHCQKSQKLHISVSGNGSSPAPANGPSALPAADSPSYTNVFGSNPLQETASLAWGIYPSPLFTVSAAFALFLFIMMA